MTVQLTTLTELMPRITDGNGIGLSQREGFQVVDYVWATPGMFSNPHEFECRGLKFDSSGKLIARPFHKFFALGEMQRFDQVDWSEDHVVLDWLDGEMIHPCPVDGRMRLLARSGLTEAARQAETIAPVAVWSLCYDLMEKGITPIFELTGPDNRMVVAYDKPELTLLAARHTASGVYLPWHELSRLALGYGVTLVRSHGTSKDPSALVAHARGLTNAAGFVVAFENGHRVILTSDWYALRRKALDGVAYEKTILEWVCQGAIEDVMDILPEDKAADVAAYYRRLQSGLAAREAEIEGFLSCHASAARRDIALAASDRFPPMIQKAVYLGLDGRSVRDGLMALLEWACHSESRIPQIREVLGLGSRENCQSRA